MSAELGFTFETLAIFCASAWGKLGLDAVSKFCELNERYFGAALPAVPVIIVPALPGGHQADCNGRMIRIAVADGASEIDARVLLHEMTHLALDLSGKDTRHDSADWKAEIARLSEIARLEQWPLNI